MTEHPVPGDVDLPAALVELVQGALARHPEVEGALVFGSRAMGRAHGGSDVDVAIEGSLAPIQLARLRSDLDDLPVPWRVDIVVLDALEHAGLRAHIAQWGRRIWPVGG